MPSGGVNAAKVEGSAKHHGAWKPLRNGSRDRFYLFPVPIAPAPCDAI